MTDTLSPLADAATQKLIDEAMRLSSATTHPLYSGSDLGIDALEFDVHVVGSSWVDGGGGATALALCGEELTDFAYGLRDSLPMCWDCAEVLEARG